MKVPETTVEVESEDPEVVEAGVAGVQGPKGDKGDKGDTPVLESISDKFIKNLF